MYARTPRRVLSRRTRPISFFCSHLTRYRPRRSGLSVIGIVMPIVGSSAPGYSQRSRILHPQEPVQRFLARKPPVSFPPSSPYQPYWLLELLRVFRIHVVDIRGRLRIRLTSSMRSSLVCCDLENRR